ncbi:hypothetical protein GS458_2998 [Geobacillus stearothermophilus]|nr:hypothetical protein GS458_2998 [Geobacillus stearothermophilus]
MENCEGGGNNKCNPYKNQEMMIISFLVYNTCQLLKIAALSSSKKLTNLKGNIEE